MGPRLRIRTRVRSNSARRLVRAWPRFSPARPLAPTPPAACARWAERKMAEFRGRRPQFNYLRPNWNRRRHSDSRRPLGSRRRRLRRWSPGLVDRDSIDSWPPSASACIRPLNDNSSPFALWPPALARDSSPASCCVSSQRDQTRANEPDRRRRCCCWAAARSLGAARAPEAMQPAISFQLI